LAKNNNMSEIKITDYIKGPVKYSQRYKCIVNGDDCVIARIVVSEIGAHDNIGESIAAAINEKMERETNSIPIKQQHP